MKQFYVYKITRLNNVEGPKFYIGYKSLKRDNGNYYGSSKLLKSDIQKYGLTYFKKEILQEFDNKNDALSFEQILLTSVDAASNSLFYNQTNGNLKFSTTGKKYENFSKTHAKNFLCGGNRTENQKQGDKCKYKVRSNKRIIADKNHSEFMKDFYKNNPSLKEHKSKQMVINNPSKLQHVREKISNAKKNKTKDNDAGRAATSRKLQGNRNCEIAWKKFANMTDVEFQLYLQTISQHPGIQGQAKKRRQLGLQLIDQTNQTLSHL
jgi:hypothetical protein